MNAPTNVNCVVRSDERDEYRKLVEKLHKDALDIKKAVAELKKLPMPEGCTAHLDDIRYSAVDVEQVAVHDLPEYEPR